MNIKPFTFTAPEDGELKIRYLKTPIKMKKGQKVTFQLDFPESKVITGEKGQSPN